LPADQRARRPGGRRDEILACFTEFVAERGYDGTNFGDLAEELGLSKGTIVHHFGTKDRMLAEQHAQYLRRRLADAHLILEWLDSAPEQLAGLIHLAVLIHRDDRAPTRAFARTVDRVRLTAEDRGIHVLGEQYTRIVRDVIRWGMDDGSFRPGDADLVALQIFGACNWAWTWFDPAGRCSAEEVAASFSDVSLAGLLVSLPPDPELTAPGGRVSRAVQRALAAGRADGTGGVAAEAG
jgi:TetR/AcrR family transcriptional regulator, cholesterol catabolism regulator